MGSFPSQKVRKVIVVLPEDAFSTFLDARSFLCADFLSDGRRKERSFSRPSGGTEKTCFWVGEEKKGPSTCKISSSYSGKRWQRLFSRPFSREIFGKTCKISSSYSGKRWHRLLVRATRANRRAAGTPLLVRRPLYGNAAVDKVEERALVRRVAKEQRRAAMVTHADARGAAKRAGSSQLSSRRRAHPHG